jgi:hypothetical protein
MLYELRAYDIHPERWDQYLAWVEKKAAPILFDQFKFRLVGVWRAIAKAGEVEPTTNLYEIFAWESEEQMRDRWAAFFTSAEWNAAWAEITDPTTDKSRYHLRTSSTLLHALPFSPLQWAPADATSRQVLGSSN